MSGHRSKGELFKDMRMAHSFEATSPPEQRLGQVLCSISQQPERGLLLSPHNSQTRLRKLRVRKKKTRAILRLIAPGLEPATFKAIRRSVRALKHAFAMHRDRQVLNARLSELGDGALQCHKEGISSENANCSNGMPRTAQLRRLKVTDYSLSRRLQSLKPHHLAWDDIAKARARLRKYYTRASADRLTRAIQRRMKKLRSRILRKARRLFVYKPRKMARLALAAHKIGFKNATGG